MKVLVIGGTGIISSDVCKECLSQGIDLTIVNRGKRENNIDAKLVVADVRNEKLSVLQSKIGNRNFDVIIDFLSYNKNQLKKTASIAKCTQYVFISTATIYEENQTHIYSEKDLKGNYGWDYCKNKYEGEIAIKEIAKKQGFKYTIVRPYVTYSEKRFPYQICPGEYYSIIYRIKNQLPIPICGLDSKTTVTSSKDFARGLVGLLGNEKAFNEDFHITSDNEIKWKEIAEILAEKFGVRCHFVDFTKEFLKNNDNRIIDIPEIIYDKSRDMKFNNSKIKLVLPEFSANTMFEESVENIFEYFTNGKTQKINYLWSGCLDRLIQNFSGVSIKKEAYSFSSKQEELMYSIGRSELLSNIYDNLKRMKHRR